MERVVELSGKERVPAVVPAGGSARHEIVYCGAIHDFMPGTKSGRSGTQGTGAGFVSRGGGRTKSTGRLRARLRTCFRTPASSPAGIS